MFGANIFGQPYFGQSFTEIIAIVITPEVVKGFIIRVQPPLTITSRNKPLYIESTQANLTVTSRQ